MERSKIMFSVLVIFIIVVITMFFVSENGMFPTGAAVLSTDNEQNAIDIIIKINEKYKNMQDFKAVKIIKNEDITKEDVMIKGDKYKIVRSRIKKEGDRFTEENEIAISDGKNTRTYKNNEDNKIEEFEDLLKITLEKNLSMYEESGIQLGRMYRMQGKFEDAEKSLMKAIELRPDHTETYVELGWIHRIQGEIKQAEEIFKKAIEVNPNDEWAYIEFGLFYINISEFQKAEEMFKKAIGINPNNERVYPKIGWAYWNLGKFKMSEEMYQKAIEVAVDKKWVYVELGVNYMGVSKIEDAEKMFKKAIEVAVDKEGVYVELGRLYIVSGKVEDAERMFKKAIEINPSLEKPYIELEKIYRIQGNIQDYNYTLNKFKVDKETSKFEIREDVSYDEIQHISEILDFNQHNFILKQNKNFYFLEGKKMKNTALWSKIKAEINKNDFSITKLEWYNEIDGKEKIIESIIYENISFDNNLDEKEFAIIEE